MPSILFLDVNMPYSDGPWMHPTCSGHHGFTCCCRMLPSKLRFMMVHVAVTWVFYAGTEDRAKHPIISRDVPWTMKKHFAEDVQFNWRASASAADSLFPQASWFLTHWGSIHSRLFPNRVSDEWSVELGELGVSPKQRCNHQLGCFTLCPGWHCVGGWAARTRGWSLTRVLGRALVLEVAIYLKIWSFQGEHEKDESCSTFNWKGSGGARHSAHLTAGAVQQWRMHRSYIW